LYTALVSNALDHARSTVTLSVSVEGRACVIRVADDGPGFPPDLAEHAFERFSSTRTGENGVRHYGLGLAIVSEIVDRHGGRVEIEPSQSGGTVAARLPLARSTTSTARPLG
jgi:two-component system OmpR family sensor kinase